MWLLLGDFSLLLIWRQVMLWVSKITSAFLGLFWVLYPCQKLDGNGNHLPILKSVHKFQWFCPHTLGRYPRLPQTPTNRKKLPNRNCWWRVRGPIFQGAHVGEILDCSFQGGYMGVSKNRGTPKWMVYNGKPWKPYQNGWFGGPLFLETPISAINPWMADVKEAGRTLRYLQLAENFRRPEKLQSPQKNIHSRKLTWNLKMMVSNRKLLFQVSIFGCHVSFRGCISKLSYQNWALKKNKFFDVTFKLPFRNSR